MDRERHEELTEQATQALAAGDAVRALALGDQIAAMDPEDPMARVIRSHALLASGAVEEAFREAQIAALLDPDNEDSQMVLALSAWRNGRIAIATEAFEKAVALSQNNPFFVAQHAWFLANEGAAKSAVQLAEQVIAKHPRTATAWAALGLAQLRMKLPVNAETSLHQALSIDPSNAEAQAAMVRVLKRRGDEGKADALTKLLYETKRHRPSDDISQETPADEIDAPELLGGQIDLITGRKRVPWIQVTVLGLGIAALAGMLLIRRPQFAILALLAAGLVYVCVLGQRLRKRP